MCIEHGRYARRRGHCSLGHLLVELCALACMCDLPVWQWYKRLKVRSAYATINAVELTAVGILAAHSVQVAFIDDGVVDAIAIGANRTIDSGTGLIASSASAVV